MSSDRLHNLLWVGIVWNLGSEQSKLTSPWGNAKMLSPKSASLDVGRRPVSPLRKSAHQPRKRTIRMSSQTEPECHTPKTCSCNAKSLEVRAAATVQNLDPCPCQTGKKLEGFRDREAGNGAMAAPTCTPPPFDRVCATSGLRHH